MTVDFTRADALIKMMEETKQQAIKEMAALNNQRDAIKAELDAVQNEINRLMDLIYGSH